MSRQLYIGIVFLINNLITFSPSFIILKTKRKYNTRISLAAVILWDVIFFTVPRILGYCPSTPQTVLLGIMPPFLWHYILFDEPLWKRLFVPSFSLALTYGIDRLCVYYVFLIIGGGYEDIIQQNEYFLAATALYNMLFLVADILWILLWQRIVDKKKNNYMLLYLIISFYQLLLLSMFLAIRKNASEHIMWISLAFLIASLLLDILMYYFFRHIERMAQTKARLSSLHLEKETVRECQIIEQQNIQKLETLHDDFVSELQKIRCMIQADPQNFSVPKTSLHSKAIFEKAKQEFYSPTPVLNALFTVKAHYARQLGIDVTIRCLHNANLMIDDIDLCSVTGNLMDNAIEACSRFDDASKTICASVIQKANYLIIEVENTVGGDFTPPSSKHRTSKSDKRNHGIGLRLVKQICSQYNGSFDLRQLTENTVCATAILDEGKNEHENCTM